MKSRLVYSRYGQSVTHMGPRTYGSRYDAGAKVRTASTNFPDGGFEADVVIKDTMTVDEKQRVDFENDRRAKVRGIKAAMEELRSQPPVMDPKVALALSIEQGDYIEPRFEPPCPQFDEIRQFLYANRTSLVLDTMDFEIPEHLLYSYVVAAGLMDLTPTEWRGFLIQCNRTAELFT